MSLSQYNIIQASSPQELAGLVNAAIDAGQQPLGNLLAFPEQNYRLFYQAVATGAPDGGGLPPGAIAVSPGDTVLVLSDGNPIGSGSALISDQQLGVETGAGQALVTDNTIISVSNSGGSKTVNASAHVVSGAASVTMDTTVALVDASTTVAVVNSAAADSHNATTTIAAGLVTHVALAATVAMVDNADVVAVVNSAGADSHNATATVSAGALTNVKLAATTALVDNTDVIVVHNSAGTVIAGSHTAEVAAGVVTDLKLAATVAGVVNGVALTGLTVSGAFTNTVTPTVANGVITGLVLS